MRVGGEKIVKKFFKIFAVMGLALTASESFGYIVCSVEQQASCSCSGAPGSGWNCGKKPGGGTVCIKWQNALNNFSEYPCDGAGAIAGGGAQSSGSGSKVQKFEASKPRVK